MRSIGNVGEARKDMVALLYCTVIVSSTSMSCILAFALLS